MADARQHRPLHIRWIRGHVALVDADACAHPVDEAYGPARSQTQPQLPIGSPGQVAVLDKAAAGSERVGAHCDGTHRDERLPSQRPEHIALGTIKSAFAEDMV